MLYLASTSPRRRDLLRKHGLSYTLVVPGDEPEASGLPIERALERAKCKARAACLQGCGPGLVLGVDTVVEVDGCEFGKPVDRADAGRMLGALSGRLHQVHTALYLWLWSRESACAEIASWSQVETADVACEELDSGRIEAYLDRADWADKAGAYGIQAEAGSFMTLVSGDMEAVIGLPVRALKSLLKRAGGVS